MSRSTTFTRFMEREWLKPRTHAECEAAAKVTQRCASWHITFGGRCLNCGYDPTRIEKEPEHGSREIAR